MDTNVLYCDDNLDRMADLPPASIDLIYLDPPFFSNRLYEVVWGDEAEVRSFEDRWEGGIQHYIGWMEKRVQEMHRLLKPTGSLYLHCDPSASHYLKVMLDTVFGSAQFRNEIVWKRSHGHNSAGRYGRSHDTILYYGRSRARGVWNKLYQAYDKSYIDKHYRHVDERGRRYKHENPTGAGIRHGATGEPWRGVDPTPKGRHWARTPDEMDKLDAAGRIYWPQKEGAWPYIKVYLDSMPGVPLQDLWVDIDPINMVAAERLGWPTQKPEALLERIIGTSTNEGDVVLDPFCGCGTSVAVAERMSRRWIGIDISTTAMRVMSKRFWIQTREWPTVINTPQTEDELRLLKPFEFQNWIIDAINGTHSPRRVHDYGIDGHWWFTREPVQVKQQDKVGRNAVDNFETAMRREGADTGYIIAFSFTRGAAEEVARAKTQEGLNIRLLRVKEVLLMVRRSGTPRNIGPQPDADVVTLPPMRKTDDLPTVEELIASDIG